MKPSKKELLRINKEFYNLHAEEFSSKRNYQWDSFWEIKKYIKKKDSVLDIGCGNGRFSLNVDKDYYLGIDSSSKLINIAKEKYKEKKFLIRDISIDGWSNDLAKFDIVLLIATLHHIPSYDLRLRIMKDIRSVTNKYFIFSYKEKPVDNTKEGIYEKVKA